MALCYITWQYGELWWAYTDPYIRNHANLLEYLTNWPLYTSENGFWATIKCQDLVQAFSAHTVQKTCQIWLLLKRGCIYCRLCNYVRGHITIYLYSTFSLMGVDQCQNVELFFWKVNLHSSIYYGWQFFYIQINCNTFGMWICISKCRNTFGMTHSISKCRNTFGMTNSISKVEHVTFDLPGYDVRCMEPFKYVFGMLQRIMIDLAMNDDGRGIQLDFFCGMRVRSRGSVSHSSVLISLVQ